MLRECTTVVVYNCVNTGEPRLHVFHLVHGHHHWGILVILWHRQVHPELRSTVLAEPLQVMQQLLGDVPSSGLPLHGGGEQAAEGRPQEVLL